MYKLIVIGIDQSYARTGITVVADGKVLKVSSISFSDCTLNSDKRRELAKVLHRLIPSCQQKATEVKVICERIRIASGGFISMAYIIATGALIATIIDTAILYGVDTYSADTRAWKSKVIGTYKPLANKLGIDPKKWPTIKFVIKMGLEDKILVEVSGRKTKGVFEKQGKRYTYNDDAADSVGIAL